jgi:hypothetical protein
LRHRVLLVFGAPCQHKKLAGQEHGRTIPLTDMGAFAVEADIRRKRNYPHYANAIKNVA